MITLAELKNYLKADADLTADDVLIAEMEEAAITYMENATGRYFGRIMELTETLNGNGWAPIWLRADPIEEDYDDVALELRTFPNGDWDALVAATDFEVAGGRLYPLAYWTPGRRTLRATYWAGYVEGEEPQDVRQAVRELVTRMYQYRSPVVTGAVVAELPFSVADTIRAHRVVVF